MLGDRHQLPAIAPSAAFRLPSAHKCVKRRRTLKVRVRSVPGVRFTSATVRLRGKHADRITNVSAAKLGKPVTLRHLPKGKFTVTVTAKATDGRKVTLRRTYHSCA